MTVTKHGPRVICHGSTLPGTTCDVCGDVMPPMSNLWAVLEANGLPRHPAPYPICTDCAPAVARQEQAVLETPKAKT